MTTYSESHDHLKKMKVRIKDFIMYARYVFLEANMTKALLHVEHSCVTSSITNQGITDSE